MTDSLPMTITAPLTNAQRAQLMTLVRRVAKAEIMPRFRNMASHQVGTKTGPDDIVTEADKAAEAMLTRGILQMFPHALIVGEEHTSEHPEVLDQIAEAELAFTIDPVDGTWNYAHGLTVFGVMVGILRFGTPVFGLLYDPVLNDFIIADTERDAEMVLPRRLQRKIGVSKGGTVAELCGNVALNIMPKDKQAEVAATYPLFQRIAMLRCACHEFRMLAQGHTDFVLASKLTPWDHAPGVIVTKKAGGHALMLDGSEYRADMSEGYLLCASDAATWDRVRDVYSFLLDTPAKPAPETEGEA